MGGGPPASRPRRELRSARRLEARPGHSAAHGHRSQSSSSASRPHKRNKIRPAPLHQRPRAKKFAQRTQNTPKSAFFRLLGEFFRGLDQNPLLLGELFRADGATAASQHLPTTLPETDDTNAGGSLPRDETAGTFASSFPHTVETTDTFARTKRRIPGHFLPAKVSRVSCTPRRAPTKAMTVSRTLINVPTELPPGSQQSCHRDHPRQALRPQPKPCVACAHATTPVAHWPHD